MHNVPIMFTLRMNCVCVDRRRHSTHTRTRAPLSRSICSNYHIKYIHTGNKGATSTTASRLPGASLADSESAIEMQRNTNTHNTTRAAVYFVLYVICRWHKIYVAFFSSILCCPRLRAHAYSSEQQTSAWRNTRPPSTKTSTSRRFRR